MRPPRPKIHTIDVDEPLFAFSDLIMRCGLTLHNAEVKYMVSQDLAKNMLPPIGTCMKCYEAAPKTAEEKRHYEYGLVEAQEEKDYREDAA